MCDVSLTLEGCFHIVVAESAKFLCLEANPGPVFRKTAGANPLRMDIKMM